MAGGALGASDARRARWGRGRPDTGGGGAGQKKRAGPPRTPRHFELFSPQPRTTLPALMHEVHTFRRLRWDTPTLACTVWMFGFHRRLVRRGGGGGDLSEAGALSQTAPTGAPPKTLWSWGLVGDKKPTPKHSGTRPKEKILFR